MSLTTLTPTQAILAHNAATLVQAHTDAVTALDILTRAHPSQPLPEAHAATLRSLLTRIAATTRPGAAP